MPSCDAQSLVTLSAARGYSKLARRDLLHAGAGQATNSWVTPPASGFSYAPASAVISWHDSGGNLSGNLATFLATANLSTITVFNANASGITSFSHIELLPTIVYFFCNHNSLSYLDVSGLTLLQEFDCGFNIITTLLMPAAMVAVTSLDCTNNRIPAADINVWLDDLFTEGPLNGTFTSIGQTPAAIPNAGKVTALQSNGWTVTTD